MKNSSTNILQRCTSFLSATCAVIYYFKTLIINLSYPLTFNFKSIKLVNVNLILLAALSLSITTKAQNETPIIFLEDGVIVSNFETVHKQKTEAYIFVDTEATIFAKHGTLVVIHEQISNHRLVFENTIHPKNIKKQTSQKWGDKPIIKLPKPKTQLTAIPFGPQNKDYFYVLANTRAVSLNNTFQFQKKITAFLAVNNFYPRVIEGKKNILPSFFHAPLSPQERFNRYFSLPPPENFV